mgnify:CR=1 FL=1
MAKKIVGTEIESKKQRVNSFCELADKTVEKRLKNVSMQAEEALFDNSHKTDRLEQVYDEIDADFLNERQKHTVEEYSSFYGDSNPFGKLKNNYSYKEVVSSPQDPVPTLEIKEEISERPNYQAKTKRKKLWLSTCAICIALFAGLFTYNMININSLAKKVVTKQMDISQSEEVLEQGNKDYLSRLKELDIEATAGMVEADLDSATKVDLTAKNNGIRFEPKTNLWDKVCNFFAKLFGR